MKITTPHEHGAIHYCPTCHAPVASTELDPVRDVLRCLEENQMVFEYLWGANGRLRIENAALREQLGLALYDPIPAHADRGK